MNDFTKDELERICQFFNIAIEDFREPDSTYELRDKIQSLIDNYRDQNCSHEIDSSIKACKKCGLPSHSIPCVGGWL